MKSSRRLVAPLFAVGSPEMVEAFVVVRSSFGVRRLRNGLAGASLRIQMWLRRDRLRLTMLLRVAPAAHSGRPALLSVPT